MISWSEQTRLAYIAGLVDGEGCISIRRRAPLPANKMRSPTFTLGLGVEMTDIEPVMFMAEHFDAAHLIRQRQRKPWKAINVLQLNGARAARALIDLRPYLHGKRSQADIALQFWELRGTSRQHRTKVLGEFEFKGGVQVGRKYSTRGLSDDFINQCEALYRALRKREQRSRWSAP